MPTERSAAGGRTYDVAIAGAGPAGSALAIEMAAEGYSVLLLDGAHFPRDKVCGDYVSPRGLARLDQLGCGPRLRSLGGTPIRSSRLYLNRELLVAGTLPSVRGLPDHGQAIPRKELDHVLVQRAVEVGATLREGCRVKGFEQGPRGVDIVCTVAGRAHREHARILVGADGATSAVAHAAGLRMTDARYTLASIRGYVRGLTLDHTIMFFDEQFFPGYGWVFPVRPGLCNVGVGMVSETLTRSGLALPDFYDKFERFVRRLAAAHGAEAALGPHKGWPIRTYGGARKNYFQRGLLIGEAACIVDPLNGEGIPLALDSARVAARTIRDAFRRGAFDEGTLARYEADWRATFDPDLGISDLVVSMIRNHHLLPVWLTAFRAMSGAASRDARYAEVTGGILGGVISARHGLAPEMFLRAVVGGSSVLRDGVLAALREPAQMLAQGRAWLRWQQELTTAMFDDPAWFRGWAREVEGKQRQVALRSLTGQLASLAAR